MRYIYILFLALASAAKAVADTLAHHFDTSIFKTWDAKFWNAAISHEFARKIGNYKVDGWHLANSTMIVFFVVALVCYKRSHFREKHEFLGVVLEIAALGTIFNVTFTAFYDYILR